MWYPLHPCKSFTNRIPVYHPHGEANADWFTSLPAHCSLRLRYIERKHGYFRKPPNSFPPLLRIESNGCLLHSHHDQVLSPNVSFSFNSSHGVPLLSTVPLLTLFPHQLRLTPGSTNEKKIKIAETATPESRAADKT